MPCVGRRGGLGAACAQLLLAAVPWTAPAPIAAQAVLQVQLESSTLTNEFVTPRRGLALLAGADAGGGGWRVRVSHLPEGDVEPGWQRVAVEFGPRLAVNPNMVIAARAFTGGQRMDVDNRHAVVAGCRPEIGCMFEAPSFRQGWSWEAGAALEMALALYRGVRLTAGFSGGALLAGANDGEGLLAWSVGAAYRF